MLLLQKGAGMNKEEPVGEHAVGGGLNTYAYNGDPEGRGGEDVTEIEKIERVYR